MRLTRVAGVLLDLDGTLYEDDTPIPGAAEVVARLRRAGLPVRFATNTTRMSRRALGDRLAALGIPAAAEEIISAPVAAATWLRAAGVRRIALCVPDVTFEDFAEFERTAERPEAVIVGDLGSAWTFERLNRAFRWLLDGAALVAVQKNRYWKTADGLTLDAGAFVAALEFAAGVTATLTGKPSPTFFTAAAASMGLAPADVMMVGDDAVSDVAGARGAGCVGVLVRTGKCRAADEVGDPAPDFVLDSVADLPDALGLAEGR
ncbi:MAG: TIGR01458 family HAD-type hydrolase [Gemmatimonadota bacterium]|nr:TIGR01458 family HAD-type hydrolase [Gemmatimonadota bacterium]